MPSTLRRGSDLIPFTNSRRDWSSVVGWAEERARRERRRRRESRVGVRVICGNVKGKTRRSTSFCQGF